MAARRMTRVLSFIAAAMVWVFAVPAAHAATSSCTGAPPGTSAIDRYCETIPAAGGDRGTTGQSGQRLAQTLTPRTVAALKRAGATGRGVLGLPAGQSLPTGRTAGAQKR